MDVNKEEIKSRLWTEWVHGLKLMGGSLQKDSIDIINSGCTTIIGNENFIQKAVMCLQHKTWIGKFKDYKMRIEAYESLIIELVADVNKLLVARKKPWYLFGGLKSPECGNRKWFDLGMQKKSNEIEYRSTLADIIIDGDDSFENEAWGDHAIDAFAKLCEYNNNIMDTLSMAQEALEKC